MQNLDKIVAWGCERLERHRQDMETLLSYLYQERARVHSPMEGQELTAMIKLLEAEKVQAATTQRRLTERVEEAA